MQATQVYPSEQNMKMATRTEVQPQIQLPKQPASKFCIPSTELFLRWSGTRMASWLQIRTGPIDDDCQARQRTAV
eukprot:2008503-Amphidinium_carterae.2